MFITVTCPTCGRRYDVAGKLAGKKVRCKDCATQFRMPVPQTMPAEPEPSAKRERKPKPEVKAPSLEDEILSDVLGSGTGEPSVETPSPSLQPVGLLPDWGATWTYKLIQLGVIAIFVLCWIFHLGSPLGIATWLSWIIGGFLLLPILGGWPSFEETRRARWIARFAGLDGAMAAQATIAIAIWIFAILITLDAIHIAALEPWPKPEPPAEQQAARDATPTT